MKNRKLKKSGSIVLVLILVGAIVILVGVVIWRIVGIGKLKQPQEAVVDLQIQELENLSSSDEIEDIEKDINATNLDNLDQELGEVDRNLGNL